MELPKLDVKRFYLMGMIIFAVVLVASTITYKERSGDYVLSEKVSSIAMLIFDLMIIWLFYTFYKIECSKLNPLSENEIQEMLDVQ